MKLNQKIYLSCILALASCQAAVAFQPEEATIEGMQSAIRSGEITCKGVVEAYLARAKAYNGVCTAVVTADGASIKPVTGAVRAGKSLVFPTKTVNAATIFPDLDQYKGLPLEYGRMEKTVSDPGVWQEQGMRVGMPDAGQLNALETLNIRGERSITCKGKFDAPPSRPLPAGAPAVCEKFRQQPDALERAAQLDAQYGKNPDLQKLPMYCVIAAFKDPYDTKDIRTTSSNDVNFAMDVPPFDSTLVAELRAKGAIIYAKSAAHEFNGGPGDPGGPNKAKANWVNGGEMISGWAGQPCNPYDTERVVRGSSGGSGAAIGGNLAMIGICEQSGASCQGPASRNGTALILTTKGIIPDNGGIGNQWFNDRAGIHARTLVDAAKVLDALKDPEHGYHDPRDPFTALPKALIPEKPYASFLVGDAAVKSGEKPLKGMRIAILREHMVKETKNHEAISDQIDQEIKTVLRDQLGAELVETSTPKYPDDPSVPNLTYTFADALSELLPRFMPEVFTRRDKDGKLFFDVPGYDVTSYDYLMKLSNRQAPLTSKVNITNFASFAATPCMTNLCSDTVFDLDRYLVARRQSCQQLEIVGGERQVPAERVGRRRTQLAGVERSQCAGQGRAACPQPGRAHGPAACDVREPYRRVRAPGEHGANAEDTGPERRHDEPRWDHAVLPDSAHRHSSGHDGCRVRACVCAERRQDRLRRRAAAGCAEEQAQTPHADFDHVLRGPGR